LSIRRIVADYAQLCLYLGGGGAQFLPNASHVIWKQAVNGTLVQADLVHCYKFHTFTGELINNILERYFWSGEDDE
jgi:hypothetical protein